MMAPNARRRRKFFGIWGAFYTKNTSPQGGQRPPQAENFWAFGGRCTQKSRCWDAFRNVFLAQNTPQNPQNFPPPAESWEKPPPYYKRINNKGGGFLKILAGFQDFDQKTPPKFFAASRRKRPNINGFRPFLAPLGAPEKICTFSYPLASFSLHSKSHLYLENDKLFLQKGI